MLNNPYHTDPSVTSLSRGTAYTYDPIVETNENLTINQTKRSAVFIDQADLAQSDFLKQMEIAERQGILLNEQVESAVYADHANRTDFGAGDITGGSVADTTTITVSATNIDDIIRHVKRVIRVANGESMMNQYGAYIVWRPADLEVLEGFMQANGFAMSDKALKDGLVQGVNYMGVTHFSSNLLTALHVMGGVAKSTGVGILRSTYGQIKTIQDPGLISGIGIVSRVDYGVKQWFNTKPVSLDINVA